MIHIYTGDGKGKTTAALGLALRGAGHGLKTVFVSFLKDGKSGESLPDAYVEHIHVHCCQTSVQGFFWNLTPEERAKLKAETQKGLLFAMQCAQGKRCDILVLDEVAGALTNQLLSEKDVLELLSAYGTRQEIVLTGRDFPAAILEIADYVSDIQEVKHPYQKGVQPREGIEY